MARTTVMVNREQFVTLLKDLKQKWIDEFDAHVAEVEAHNEAVPAAQAKHWTEVQKAVKKAAAEIAKHPGPEGDYRMPYTELWSTNGTVGRGVVTIHVPERPIKKQVPRRENLDHYIQSVDNDIRLLEMGVDEKVRLSADMQHWLDPQWSDTSRLARW